jgi:integrase/recombinase XerC
LVERYLDHVRIERRMSAHTEAGYRRDLTKLIRYCARTNIEEWGEIDPHSARRFAGEMRRQGLSVRSIQRALSASRGFFRFLLKNKEVKTNPFSGTAAPKPEKRLPKVLTVDQVNLLVAVEGEDPLAIRDRAIMELFYSSGLRLSELVELDLPLIDLRNASVRVTGKGNKEREVPVGRYAVAAIGAWLPVRSEMADAQVQALFVTSRGGRISTRAVQQRIRLWARRQGLDSSVHPHMLRHSFATHVLESSGELRSVQELLGHANISTTQVYTHLDFQHLARVYDKAHPRAKIGAKARMKTGAKKC